MPAKLAEIIDLIYFVTNGEQQKVKKFMQYLKTVLEKFQEAVEVKVLAAVNNIGQQAQCLRPDNARVRRTCEPGVGEKQVDLASRYKWLSGTLHLLVRKLFESKEQSEVARLELIQKHVEICLHQLSEETKMPVVCSWTKYLMREGRKCRRLSALKTCCSLCRRS